MHSIEIKIFERYMVATKCLLDFFHHLVQQNIMFYYKIHFNRMLESLRLVSISFILFFAKLLIDNERINCIFIRFYNFSVAADLCFFFHLVKDICCCCCFFLFTFSLFKFFLTFRHKLNVNFPFVYIVKNSGCERTVSFNMKYAM